MANRKISELTSAGALTGTELVEVVQGGVNKQTTTQDIADLGGGGGGGTVESVTGDGVDNTDPDNPVLSFPTPAEIAAQALVNSATALVDGATIDLTAIKHTLTSSAATRTFTISYTGDDITMEVTLNATEAVYTFPATSLCVTDGVASGDNTCALTGISGDKHIFAIKKIGSAYYVVSKNFGQ